MPLIPGKRPTEVQLHFVVFFDERLFAKPNYLRRLTSLLDMDLETFRHLTAVSVAALTVYDMCKAVDKGMVIGDVRLLEKTKETDGT